MEPQRRIHFAVLCAWLSKAAGVFGNLLVMPLLFRRMEPETLGLWFTLNGSATLVGLLGLGVTPALTREIARQSNPFGESSPTDVSLLEDLVATGRTLLRWLAISSALLMLNLGIFFIRQVPLVHLPLSTVLAAWTLLCAGFALSTWTSWLDACLSGRGQVGWDGLIGGCTLLVTYLGTSLVVTMGGGLLALSVVPLVAGLLNRGLLYRTLRWKLPELLSVPGRYQPKLARALVRPAATSWFGSVGAFLILRTDNYFIATLRGAAEIPAYQAAYSLAFNLFQVAISRAAASCVFVGQSWRADAPGGAHALVLEAARFAAVLMGTGTAFLLTSGQALTDLWLGPGHFVGWPVLVVLCLTVTLEAQHCTLVYAAWSAGDDVYAPWSLGAGLLNLLLTALLIRPLGLLGVALGTCLAQLLTNNWYCVWRPCLYLGLPFGRYAWSIWPVWGLTLGGCAAFQLLTLRLLLPDAAGRWPLALGINALISAAALAFCLRKELGSGLRRRSGFSKTGSPLDVTVSLP